MVQLEWRQKNGSHFSLEEEPLSVINIALASLLGCLFLLLGGMLIVYDQ